MKIFSRLSFNSMVSGAALFMMMAFMSIGTSWAGSSTEAVQIAPTTAAPQTNQQTSASEVSVLLKTSAGDITLTLDAKKAPLTVSNFLQYVKSGFYENLVFHRVIPGFMIQGGGLDAALVKKNPKAAIKNEADNGLKNNRGTIAMARTNDINSATSQFFINLADNANLNHANRYQFGYAVFGQVSSGMDVVDKIAKTPTKKQSFRQNVPVKPITILKAEILSDNKNTASTEDSPKR